MKGHIPWQMIFPAILLGITILSRPLFGAEGLRIGYGELAGIEANNRSLVVDLPYGNQLFRVGGPVSPDAVLMIGEQDADLSAFRIGDAVKVGWRRTPEGHEIKILKAVSRAEKARGIYFDPDAKTIIGSPGLHLIEKDETLLDIARSYDLGFNEIEDLYPGLDPWIPPAGTRLIIPSQWVLPETRKNGIVINVAELRLYSFFTLGRHHMVRTYPIGVGDLDWPTPLGVFRIGEKRVDPTWFLPPSLRGKYGVKFIPPGPDNPLGKYWLGLGNSSYGIHGTDIPWSVGRLVTHGCIRLYPEDIDDLFKTVEIGTPVKIIYEPVKIGVISGNICAEVHRDIYGLIEDFKGYGLNRLKESGTAREVDMEKFRRAMDRQDGLPVDITFREEVLHGAPADVPEVCADLPPFSGLKGTFN